jgi:hypothetical protein
VAVVATHWHAKGSDLFQNQEALFREFQTGPWKKWLDTGEQLHRTNNTEEDTHKIMDALMENEERVYTLQYHVEREQRNGLDEWRAVENVIRMFEQRLKENAIEERPKVRAQLCVLRAWAAYVKPSLGSRIKALVFK